MSVLCPFALSQGNFIPVAPTFCYALDSSIDGIRLCKNPATQVALYPNSIKMFRGGPRNQYFSKDSRVISMCSKYWKPLLYAVTSGSHIHIPKALRFIIIIFCHAHV